MLGSIVLSAVSVFTSPPAELSEIGEGIEQLLAEYAAYCYNYAGSITYETDAGDVVKELPFSGLYETIPGGFSYAEVDWIMRVDRHGQPAVRTYYVLETPQLIAMGIRYSDLADSVVDTWFRQEGDSAPPKIYRDRLAVNAPPKPLEVWLAGGTQGLTELLTFKGVRWGTANLADDAQFELFTDLTEPHASKTFVVQPFNGQTVIRSIESLRRNGAVHHQYDFGIGREGDDGLTISDLLFLESPRTESIVGVDGTVSEVSCSRIRTTTTIRDIRDRSAELAPDDFRLSRLGLQSGQIFASRDSNGALVTQRFIADGVYEEVTSARSHALVPIRDESPLILGISLTKERPTSQSSWGAAVFAVVAVTSLLFALIPPSLYRRKE